MSKRNTSQKRVRAFNWRANRAKAFRADIQSRKKKGEKVTVVSGRTGKTVNLRSKPHFCCPDCTKKDATAHAEKVDQVELANVRKHTIKLGGDKA